jgi:hypothetical protein
MREISEDYVQNQIWEWYTNNYCLKHHNPRCMIFSVPNGGKRDAREAKRLKLTGLLPGVSDLIIIHMGKIIFVEVKKPVGGRQEEAQKDFQARIEALGYDYHLVTSLEDFVAIVL